MNSNLNSKMNFGALFLAYFLSVAVLLPSSASAWGKRGHEIVASSAARILEDTDYKGFLRNYEFDLGYYTNVPDLIWRNINKEISETEGPQHYIDWNKGMESVFGSPKNLPVEFSDFKAKMGDKFKIKDGVVPYRIHGLMARCRAFAQHLTFEKQGPLLECMGEVSHYTGDLGMPLHVSENHDGQLTGQEGVHVYFESDLVDALDPDVKITAMQVALKNYEKSPMRNMNTDEAVRWLIADSATKVDQLLAIDKKTDRTKVRQAAQKFKPLIIQRLSQGAILTAVAWREILSTVQDFDTKNFRFFDGRPDYVEPGKELP